ncbi:hypothetical protein LT493_12100 [Streptomyces tricolor]|nr:hypothetical protein [Streptomyces tricolor]
MADHVVRGTALVPATVFLSLLGEAGERIGRPVVADLTLGVPLPLPGTGGGGSADRPRTRGRRRTQGPDRARAPGRRRLGPARHGRAGRPRHCAGRPARALVHRGRRPGRPHREPTSGSPGAVTTTDRHSPDCAGLWTRGAEILAEVTPPDADPAGFATAHPALLDAALHPAVLQAGAGPAGAVRLAGHPPAAHRHPDPARARGTGRRRTVPDPLRRAGPGSSVRHGRWPCGRCPPRIAASALEPAWSGSCAAPDGLGPDDWVTVARGRSRGTGRTSPTWVGDAPGAGGRRGPLGSAAGADGGAAHAERLAPRRRRPGAELARPPPFTASRLAVVTRGAPPSSTANPSVTWPPLRSRWTRRSAGRAPRHPSPLIDVDDDPASLGPAAGARLR